VARHNTPSKPKRIWRISERAPLGEWVDPNIPSEPRKKDAGPAPTSEEIWRRSTFDLLNGIEVNDDPTTVPDDLFDEYFKPVVEDPPKSPKR
jgi:hypothetical protein